MTKQRFSLLLVFATLMGSLFVASCKNDEETTIDCTGVTATYTTDVKPIFDASCATAGCHDSNTKAHGLDLSTYVGSKEGAINHEVVCSIEQNSGCDPMPEGGDKLSDAQIKKVRCWIQSGTPQ